MDKEMIAQLANDVNNVVVATAKPYQKQIDKLESKLQAIYLAATKWPRCCDLWQDGLRGMSCQKCAQKTFTMLRNIQEILKVDKACNPID